MKKRLRKKMTATQFYHQYVKPTCRVAMDLSPKTIDLDEIALKYWRRFTGDPPLKKITRKTVLKFAMGLKTLPGRDGNMAPSTQQTRIVHMQTILHLAGPQTPDHDMAVGLFKRPLPRIPRPKVVQGDPKMLPMRQIEAWLRACDYAGSPRLPNIHPPTWWRALILYTYNTGMRIDTIMKSEWAWLDDEGWLSVPAWAYKGGRMFRRFYVNSFAREAIEVLRDSGYDRIVPWPNYPESDRWLQDRRAWLWKKAGITDQKGNGFHGLRRTLLNEVAKEDIEVARVVAGHTRGDVLMEHYVNRDELISQALDGVRQPFDAEQETEHRKAA